MVRLISDNNWLNNIKYIIILIYNTISLDTPEVAKRVKRIDQKLNSFKQVVVSSREACEQFMNNNCEKMS